MRALCDTLEYEGYQTYGFTSPNEALAAMRERSFDLLLADLQMPGTNGIDLMKSAQLIDPTLVAVIMIAGLFPDTHGRELEETSGDDLPDVPPHPSDVPLEPGDEGVGVIGAIP